MSKVPQLLINNALGAARISLFGGQVLSFCPKHDNRERLFLSSKALLDGSKSIRGGIPLCWPWFGAYKGPVNNTPMPAHGFARTHRWEVVDITDKAGGTEVLLQLDDPKAPGFDGTAQVQVLISVGSKLKVGLYTLNQGSETFALSAALHTYFAVADIRQTQLRGLSGLYLDKTQNWATLPTPQSYGFTGETDRIHLTAAPLVEIASGKSVVSVESEGHDSVVVWNPWDNGSKAFADLASDEYQHFVCVETALTLSPHESN